MIDHKQNPAEGVREEDATRYVREDIYLALQAQVEVLKNELTLSTDQNDLLLDEFIRVKHLTDNTEIHALCERAHVRMRQRVSVIERNFKQAEEIKELKAQVDRLLEPAKEAAEALGFASHHLRGRASENMLMDMAEKADELISAIGSIPAQCLAEIKAQAVEEFISEFDRAYPVFSNKRPFHAPIGMMNCVAKQLRQQAKGE